MEESTIIIGVPPAKLENLIADAVAAGLRSYRSDKEQERGASAEELLTRQEAANLLGITLPTLREYTKQGLVMGYRIGTRVRYKRSEVLGSLEEIRTSKKDRK